MRDSDNKDFLIDKFYLGLKVKKEDARLETPVDPNAHRYTNMSYIAYLGRQQRMFEKGALVDDFEDEEENQSEDESEGNEENEKTKTTAKTPGNKADANKTTSAAFAPIGGGVGGMPSTLPGVGQTPGANGIQTGQITDYSKILVAGEGFGREFLKNEIDRLIKML